MLSRHRHAVKIMKSQIDRDGENLLILEANFGSEFTASCDSSKRYL